MEDSIKKSFQVGSGGRLTVDSERGSIEVQAADNNNVEVEVIRKGSDKILKDFEIEFDQDGNDANIQARLKRDVKSFWGWIGGSRLKVRYLISVPRKYNVDLKTMGGSISVGDLEGEVKGDTAGGSLHFGQVKGPVRGKTLGGSITLDGCVGTAQVDTAGGSIKIGEVEGDVTAHTLGGSVHINKAKGGVIAETSGGSITVEEVMGQIEAKTMGGGVRANISRQPLGDCRLETSGGNISVGLGDEVALSVDAQTSGGRVKSEFPVTVQRELVTSELRSEINGGGPELVLRNLGGSINLRRL